MVPLARLEWVAGLKGVAAVRLPPSVRQSSLVSEGVAASRTDVLRALGDSERIPELLRGRLDGKGLTVAIIDGFGASDIAKLREAGEWPAAENTVQIPPNGYAFGYAEDRHGNAVTEILYDVAPGANYRLYDVGEEHSKYPGAMSVNLIRAIQDAAHLDLNNQRLGPPRAQIISMSLADFGNSPGDGTPGDGEARGMYEAIEAARGNGVLTVVGAGNSADSHWDGQSTEGGGTQVAQDFGSEAPNAAGAGVPDEVNIVRLVSELRTGDAKYDDCIPFYPSGLLARLRQFELNLAWSDWPTRWTNASSDYRLELVRWTDAEVRDDNGVQTVVEPAGWTVVASGDAVQDGSLGSLPNERLSYVASDADRTQRCAGMVSAYPGSRASGGGIFGVRIVRKTPRGGHFLRLFLGNTLHAPNYAVMARSLGSPADSPWVVAVGAKSLLDGYDASYSSRGPVLGPGGVLPTVAADTPKPDLTSFTVVRNLSVGYMEGTSAATPHAAGLALLALQHHRQLALMEAQKAAKIPASELTWYTGLAETTLTGVVRPDATESQRQARVQMTNQREKDLIDATLRTLKAVAGKRENRLSEDAVDNTYGYGLLRFDERSQWCFLAQLYAPAASSRHWLIPQYLRAEGETAYDDLYATYRDDCLGD
ncbi:S8 family serine peptidase [Lysobacter sp. K5869]|uniref:S8 family serine peptidase n=1 Tax=Lysobacter sp. K5869 TaxID=2820808 RepID=UPI001C06428B|nr:S8 family serine peptidase [Lysobacter sp. K5869]QWP78068.1 S8 family serine peptidase [Lysobacter sp. K5869]